MVPEKKAGQKHHCRLKKKIEKYYDCDPNLVVLKKKERPCSHDGKTFKCNSVQYTDIAKNRFQLYSAEGKINQDRVLMRFISSIEPNRKRMKDGTKPKTVTLKFFMNTKSEGMLQVCKSFFCYAMGIPKSRVLRIGKVINDGLVPNEKRGGDRKSREFANKKNNVKTFLNNLQCSESHYGRNKSKRVYLSGDLNIAKLYKLYNKDDNNIAVTFPFFYKIFSREFNIGFGTPASDACSLCIRLKNEIASNMGNEANLTDLKINLRIHNLRANAFYEIMKKTQNEENTLSVAFDLQQVHPLPKTPIQEAFYSRQIGFYAFCCVSLDSRDPTFYTWSEDQAGRGSVEIGSALIHHLRSLNLNVNISKIFLFCDGCAGQNRNAHVVHTLCHWLKMESPDHVKIIQITYPVRGHSFLPADRAFGRVEKILRKNVEIKTREEYVKFYKQVGTVNELGKDWAVYNIKELENVYSKIKGISDVKRLFVSKHRSRNGEVFTKVQYFSNYKFSTSIEIANSRSIVKKNKREGSVALVEQPLKHALSVEKKRDVAKLLEKHFGVNWGSIPDLLWYKNIFEESDGHMNENDEPIICDCMEEDCVVI